MVTKMLRRTAVVAGIILVPALVFAQSGRGPGPGPIPVLPSGSPGDIQTYATTSTLSHITPGTGVATALGNAVDLSGGLCTVGGGACGTTPPVASFLGWDGSGFVGGSFGSGLNLSGGVLTATGATAPAVNRITSGTTNTLASITSTFTTQLWLSATSGAKTQNIPGCVSGLNADYLAVVDGQLTAGTNAITITPASGSIGPDAAATLEITSNAGAVLLQCDGTGTVWRQVADSVSGSTVRYAASTSLTVAATDNGGVIQQSNGSSVAATIAQAGTSGFPLGRYQTIIQNVGAGTITLTPTTSTINGAATATIPQNASLLVFADLAGNYIGVAIPAVPAATVSLAGIAKLHNVPVAAGWVATINPNNVVIANINQASTISAIVGSVEVATGGTSTVSVYKAPSGTACSAGTILHSGSFNANGTAATNQTLTLVGGATDNLAAGDRLCLQTTGTTGWTSGTGIGTITVFLAPTP